MRLIVPRAGWLEVDCVRQLAKGVPSADKASQHTGCADIPPIDRRPAPSVARSGDLAGLGRLERVAAVPALGSARAAHVTRIQRTFARELASPLLAAHAASRGRPT
eukprot:6184465-Prymnesium_polylepis.2